MALDRYTALFQILAADPGIQATVGDQIFPLVAPQEASLPFVVARTVSSEPVQTKSGPAEKITFSMALDVFAETGDQTREIGVAIRKALDFKSQLSLGVHLIRYENETDDFLFTTRTFVLTLIFSLPMEGQ